MNLWLDLKPLARINEAKTNHKSHWHWLFAKKSRIVSNYQRNDWFTCSTPQIPSWEQNSLHLKLPNSVWHLTPLVLAGLKMFFSFLKSQPWQTALREMKCLHFKMIDLSLILEVGDYVLMEGKWCCFQYPAKKHKDLSLLQKETEQLDSLPENCFWQWLELRFVSLGPKSPRP